MQQYTIRLKNVHTCRTSFNFVESYIHASERLTNFGIVQQSLKRFSSIHINVVGQTPFYLVCYPRPIYTRPLKNVLFVYTQLVQSTIFKWTETDLIQRYYFFKEVGDKRKILQGSIVYFIKGRSPFKIKNEVLHYKVPLLKMSTERRKCYQFLL